MGRPTSAILPPILWPRGALQRRREIAKGRRTRHTARLAPFLIRDRFSSHCVWRGKTFRVEPARAGSARRCSETMEALEPRARWQCDVSLLYQRADCGAIEGLSA